MSGILFPIGLMTGLGLLLGAVLSTASRLLVVDDSAMIGAIRACLPGVNCGACGYPGCDAYAQALVEEGVSRDLCIPGGQKVIQEITQAMEG